MEFDMGSIEFDSGGFDAPSEGFDSGGFEAPDIEISSEEIAPISEEILSNAPVEEPPDFSESKFVTPPETPQAEIYENDPIPGIIPLNELTTPETGDMVFEERSVELPTEQELPAKEWVTTPETTSETEDVVFEEQSVELPTEQEFPAEEWVAIPETTSEIEVIDQLPVEEDLQEPDISDTQNTNPDEVSIIDVSSPENIDDADLPMPEPSLYEPLPDDPGIPNNPEPSYGEPSTDFPIAENGVNSGEVGSPENFSLSESEPPEAEQHIGPEQEEERINPEHIIETEPGGSYRPSWPMSPSQIEEDSIINQADTHDRAVPAYNGEDEIDHTIIEDKLDWNNLETNPLINPDQQVLEDSSTRTDAEAVDNVEDEKVNPRLNAPNVILPGNDVQSDLQEDDNRTSNDATEEKNLDGNTSSGQFAPVEPVAMPKPINSGYAGENYSLEDAAERKLDSTDFVTFEDGSVQLDDEKLLDVLDAQDLAERYPDGVQFDEQGYPDFSPYAYVNPETGDPVVVEIDMQGNHRSDYDAANAAAGLDETPEGYTWHHHQDTKTMVLVPTDLHDAVRHSGGVSVINYRNKVEGS